MKRNNLTTAIVTGIAGVAGFASLANAVNLNPDGLGQVLIYPYYTVNGSKNTLLSVVNTRNIAKAVKVRFLEGHNSREVLDFNLFLSPYDVWTAAVFSTGDATSPAGIVTDDKSCTAPQIRGNASLPKLADGRNYAPFVNYAYAGSNNDTGPEDLDRTREGHIELIEMAELTGTLAANVTHISGTPKSCAAVQSLSAATAEMTAPRGGLFGAGGIVNGAEGTFYTYNADAVDGFSNIVLFSGPNSTLPSLAQANTGLGVATSYTFNNGVLITSDYPTPAQGIDAVSAVFAADAIYNEYIVEPTSGSHSSWVVTFPTKRFYVDPQAVGAGNPVIPPFVELFGENADDLSCVEVGISIFDREEGQPSGPTIGFSPPPPGQPPSALCKESNVITFGGNGTTDAVFSSTLITNIPAFATSGWVRLDLNPGTEPHVMRASTDGDAFNGLPVTGFLGVNYVNNNLVGGVLANYSGLYRHRASRSCLNAGLACS